MQSGALFLTQGIWTIRNLNFRVFSFKFCSPCRPEISHQRSGAVVCGPLPRLGWCIQVQSAWPSPEHQPLRCLAFHWGIPALGCVGKSAANECEAPSSGAAEQVLGGALAVFLEQPVHDPSLCPICGQASRLGLVKNLNPMADFLQDGQLGLLECVL